jgi:hypothetical protein
MDSPVVARLFRQLFQHRARGCTQNLGPSSHGSSIGHGAADRHNRGVAHRQSRGYATRNRASRDRGMKSNESRWQQRTTLLPEDRTAEFEQYPSLTMEDLKQRKTRPIRAKMLLRDFIDGECPPAGHGPLRNRTP